MSKRLGRALARLVEAATVVQKPGRRAATRLLAAQQLQRPQVVPTRHGAMTLLVSDPGELLYPREFHSREPETLAWIDGFAAPARFWDIGANIGLYALYAGLRGGVEVLAFEPHAANYLALCRNIGANRLAERVRGLCLAFADRVELGDLNLSQLSPGAVFNVFNDTETCFGTPIEVAGRQGMLGFSIDAFRRVFALPAPNYLKIDVDSVEEQILAGAAETLCDPELRSVLIELELADTARNARIERRLREAGFALSHRADKAQGGSLNAIFTRIEAGAGAADAHHASVDAHAVR